MAKPITGRNHDCHVKFTEEQWSRLVARAEKENRNVKNLIETIVIAELNQPSQEKK